MAPTSVTAHSQRPAVLRSAAADCHNFAFGDADPGTGDAHEAKGRKDPSGCIYRSGLGHPIPCALNGLPAGSDGTNGTRMLFRHETGKDFAPGLEAPLGDASPSDNAMLTGDRHRLRAEHGPRASGPLQLMCFFGRVGTGMRTTGPRRSMGSSEHGHPSDRVFLHCAPILDKGSIPSDVRLSPPQPRPTCLGGRGQPFRGNNSGEGRPLSLFRDPPPSI